VIETHFFLASKVRLVKYGFHCPNLYETHPHPVCSMDISLHRVLSKSNGKCWKHGQHLLTPSIKEWLFLYQLKKNSADWKSDLINDIRSKRERERETGGQTNMVSK
jgi:hypothetical protein